jgi:general secretion pathway protein G
MTRALPGPQRRRAAGFTLIELMVTAVLVGILALTAMPLAEVTAVKQREVELRLALRTIRSALDAYKAATDAGVLAKGAGESGYPASLEMLTQPLETARTRPGPPGAAEPAPRMVLLRQLPRDPFHTDPATPAAQTWATRSYASHADDPQPGADVFDVASRSPRIALDGTPYRSW